MKLIRTILLATALIGAAWLTFAAGTPHAEAAGPRWRRAGSGEYDNGTGTYGQPTLPQGRRYYNGRYFGNLNNRFYGPQYGYF